jgi:hypothetical protein
MWSKKSTILTVLLLATLFFLAEAGAAIRSADFPGITTAATDDDLVFIHHSVGSNWLNSGLETKLLQKPYIDERNDIGYGTAMDPDANRPPSLGAKPGDLTDMNHWILWFNDYLEGVRAHGSATGFNRITMFKSCYPNSQVASDGVEPGDPFSAEKTLANYKAIFRHPTGPGQVYDRAGIEYRPLEDVFAANADVLFVVVTSPPLHYAPSDATNDANAHRARRFNNWLKNTWLPAYNFAHPDLDNVVVFDLFDVLAYPDNHPLHPNRLRAEYGGESGDSHPNEAGNDAATDLFAGEGAFLDTAWKDYVEEDTPLPWRQYIPFCRLSVLGHGAGLACAS